MATDELPFLEHDPPPWAARGLATAVLAVAALAALASVIVSIPETVTGPFVLVPSQGTDPVRAPREGIVTRVYRSDATVVRRADTLFTISSDPARDRAAERRALEVAVADAPDSRRDVASQLAGVRATDAGERRRLDSRIETLKRSLIAREQQLEIARDLESRARQGMATGVATATELAGLRLSASRTEDELSVARGDLEDAQAARTRLDFESAAREAELRTRARRIDLELAQASARLSAMRGGQAERDAALVVLSPCAGTILQSRVRAAGAVVQQGDVLADVACTGDSFVAEIALPATGVARVRPGQSVRLLYAAFPYQRHGVRFGEVVWAGSAPGGATATEPSGFRARVRPDDATITVDGEPRALMPGMGGVARVIIGRRRLISYAFEPLRALREAAADRRPQQ